MKSRCLNKTLIGLQLLLHLYLFCVRLTVLFFKVIHVNRKKKEKIQSQKEEVELDAQKLQIFQPN